jgi:hypothetical protein
VRRFLYVSRPRLAELYGQSATRAELTRRRIRGLQASTPIGGGGLQLDPREAQKQLEAECRRVLARLDSEELLGTVDEPREYFRGSLPMYMRTVDLISPAMLYMVGATEKTTVALAGPLRHVVGRDAESSRSKPGALLVTDESAVVEAALAAWRNDDGGDDENLQSTAPPSRSTWDANVHETHWLFETDANARATDVAFLAWREASALYEGVEQSGARNTVLGRPVFACYA